MSLDIPQAQVTQRCLEYWRLQDKNNLESLYIVTNGKAGNLWKLYRELLIKSVMSYEKVPDLSDIDLHKLPYMESLLKRTTRAAL